MQVKRYKPLVDKLFYIILIPTVLLLIAFTVISAFEPTMLLVTVPVDIVCLYFLISPLFGYAELRESSLFIKFGFFMKREIPYSKIRGISCARKWYSDSMLSLKNSMEHLNIKYNSFDMVSISVCENAAFGEELKLRCRGAFNGEKI